MLRKVGTIAARVDLVSELAIIYEPRYFTAGTTESLLTDYREIIELPENTVTDGSLTIIEDAAVSCIDVNYNKVTARGPFRQLEDAMADKRYTLLGNQGLMYRFLLFLLEEFHSIYSFHANALYNPSTHTLTIVLGGAATGKSPALLAGVVKGLEVFGTELVHMQLTDKGLMFYKSSTIDNIRLQAITEDFPELIKRLTLPSDGKVSSPSGKYPVDLSAFGAKEQAICTPNVRLVLPRTEAGRVHPIIDRIDKAGTLIKLLFDNASEKISASFTLYNHMAASGFDNPQLASRRFLAMRRLVEEGCISQASMILAQPRYFLEVL
jgi:hypothetical protein